MSEQLVALGKFMTDQGISLESMETSMEMFLAQDAEGEAEGTKLLKAIEVKEDELKVASMFHMFLFFSNKEMLLHPVDRISSPTSEKQKK